MRKRDIVDGLVGPRTRETMDQLLCMNGMTNAEKVDFLMSRNRELRAENERLRSCLSDDVDNARQIMGENAKLRELFAEVWPIAEYAGYEHELSRARELMRELGMEVDA